MWMCDYLKRSNNGILNNLELNESFLFKNFTRMSRENFYNLLELVRAKIEKKNTTFREAVPPEIRLAICLRYLATGDSFASLMYLFKVSKPLISSMMPGVLKAIIEALQDFFKLPANEDEWKLVSHDFNEVWNYPHCIGALDGKHVQIQRPENTVAEYYNSTIVFPNFNFFGDRIL
ncbi:uncharacterized protein LOC124366548 [Homalodisca vitripennis]|uniref:uncharacterized protein LOC124366548 n=1 Tax=Homalodisca vitripennis TaxID=197043 RepID=UPI001EEAEBF0|nr:uncharacterized protein LOC124366548 [Homalodisca vitripennis]